MRRHMRLTQQQFAGYFGFPVATLRHWELGDRRPTGTAYILLQLIRENPRWVLQVVRKARARSPASVAPIKAAKSYRAPPGMRRPVY
jgi:transcriptional regulator with XRE-family HTH domain